MLEDLPYSCLWVCDLLCIDVMLLPRVSLYLFVTMTTPQLGMLKNMTLCTRTQTQSHLHTQCINSLIRRLWPAEQWKSFLSQHPLCPTRMQTDVKSNKEVEKQ